MIVWLLDKQNTLIFPEVVEFLKSKQRWTKLVISHEEYNIAPIQNLTKIDNFWTKIQLHEFDIEPDIINIINQKKDCEYVHEPYGYYYNLTREEDKIKYQNEINEWKLGVSKLKQEIKRKYIEKWLILKNEYEVGNTQKLERDISIASEVPIIGYNKFIIGYWDIVIEFQIPYYRSNNFLFWQGIEQDGDKIVSGTISGVPKYIITSKPIFIEVKPMIRSFGETLRQLKTYHSFVPNAIGSTYLLTVDVKFRVAFESQGINVVEYHPNTM